MITTQVDATAAISQILQSSDNSLQLRNITSSSHACYASFTNAHSMGTLLDPLTGLSINTTNGYSENAYLLPNDGLIMSSGSPNDFCINDSDQQTTQWKNNTRYVESISSRAYGLNKQPKGVCGLTLFGAYDSSKPPRLLDSLFLLTIFVIVVG